jgi:hypothetical protein
MRVESGTNGCESCPMSYTGLIVLELRILLLDLFNYCPGTRCKTTTTTTIDMRAYLLK